MFRRTTYANVVATLALLLAICGTSVAASKYVITSGRQIKPGSIATRNLSAGARRKLRGQAGPQGAQGPQGERGATGEAGPRGETGPAGPVEGVSALGALGLELPTPLVSQFDGEVVTFTTSHAGRLWLDVSQQAFVYCPTSAVYWFASLDGRPQRGTVMLLSSATSSSQVTVAGVTDEIVPAGTHQVSLSARCVNGSVTGKGWVSAAQASAIVLGS